MIDDRLSALALAHRDRLLERNPAIVRGNARLLNAWVAGEPHLDYVKPRAGTTAFIRYDYPVASRELCQGIFDASGAFVVPGSAFALPSSAFAAPNAGPSEPSSASSVPDSPVGAERDFEHWFRVGYASSRAVLEGDLAAISAYLRELGRAL